MRENESERAAATPSRPARAPKREPAEQQSDKSRLETESMDSILGVDDFEEDEEYEEGYGDEEDEFASEDGDEDF